MPVSGRVSQRTLATIVGLLGAVALLLALVLGSHDDDDEPSAVDEAPATATPDDAGKRRPIDSGKRMLDANKASVTGTIRDSEGTPIAGALVCAQANQDELLGAGDKLPQCSKSERDGHYRLDGLWPVATTIDAGAPQFIPARWSERVDGQERHELRLHAGEERREIDITLARGGVPVRGVVKDIGGGVIEDALVTSTSGLWNFGQALAFGRSDGEGRFELWTKSGQASLTAHAEGYAPAHTSASAPTELATIFLTPESTLGGIVVHAETGEPVAGVTVRAAAGRMGIRIGTNQTITDADGRFRIASLAPGIYDVKAHADELYGEGVEQVHLGLSQSIDDIVVEVHPAFAVAGKVVIAETNAPCPEGEVTLERDGQQLAGRVDEHGEVLVRAVLPGTYQVQVRCTGHVSEPEYEPIVIAGDSQVELAWKVHTGLAIRGVLVDSGAAPVAGVSVIASPKASPGDPRGRQTWGWNTATQSDGTFELAGLLPGSYELDIWSMGHPKLAQPEVVTLGEAADVDNVRLVLPATGRLVGIVRDQNGAAASGVGVSATSLARNQQWMQSSARTGDDGRFVIERLEAGSFRVQASGRRAPGSTDDDIQGTIVEIVPDRETEIELIVESRTMSIRGRVVDSAGAPVFDAFVDVSRMSDSAAAGPTNFASARWGWDRKPVLSDHDGNFEVGELSEGDYIVRAYRKGGGEGLLERVAAGSTGVVLEIGDTGQLAGKVVLAGGGSPDRFEIRVSDRAQGVGRTDDFFRTDGGFAIRELPPGTYEIQATASEGTAKTEVVLTAGQSIDDLALELTSKVTVEGRLIDADTRAPVPGMEVMISGGGNNFTLERNTSKQEHVSDADGRFRVEGVQVGKVRVRISPRNFNVGDGAYASTSRDLRLPPEPTVQDIGEIELLPSRVKNDEKTGDLGYTLMRLAPELEPEDRYFEVAVIRPGGPAENTGLAVGDRIVEVDGRSVAGLDSHRYHTLTRAPPGTSIVLGIEGGKQVTVVLGQPVQ